MAQDEKTYYQDGSVHVTSARVVLGQKTYAMSNIISVSLKMSKHVMRGIILGLLGIIIPWGSIGFYFQGHNT